MGNTNEKKFYEVAAEFFKEKIEEANSKLPKPLKLKTKLNNFEREFASIIKNDAKYLDEMDYSVNADVNTCLIKLTDKIGIPPYLVPNDVRIHIDEDRNITVFTKDTVKGNVIFKNIGKVTKTEDTSEDKKDSKKKAEKVDFQNIFDKSFNKVIVKANPITTKAEATNLVRQYYDIQKLRLASGNRQFQLDNTGEEVATKKTEDSKNISFAYANAGLKETEETIARWLEEYVKNDPIGKWLMKVKGIGPVLAAGLISYIDISKCQTAGSIWKFAGWEGHCSPKKKGVKLDYNPDFRVLCWKLGEQFQKVSGYAKDENDNVILDVNGNPVYRIKDALYGHLYAEKLKEYIAKNEAGGFAENAKLALSEKNFSAGPTKECYESGKLPMAHLISMAKRYAVKIFLSHLFEVWYEYENKCKPPRPFVQVYCGHVHMIEAPNKELLGL